MNKKNNNGNKPVDQAEAIWTDQEMEIEDKVLTMSMLFLKEGDEELRKAMDILTSQSAKPEDKEAAKKHARAKLDERAEMLVKLKQMLKKYDTPKNRNAKAILKQ